VVDAEIDYRFSVAMWTDYVCPLITGEV